jgi:Phosphatidylinositol-specific phospholipase C, X domain
MPHTAYGSPATRRRWPALLAAVAVGGAAAIAMAPGTALAADPSYRTLTSTSNPDWMRALPDSRSLASISIPGTHETMAIHGGSLTETQENYGDSGATLATQLNAGIRMIDIRARVNSGNSLTIHHGAVYQNANFTDVLNTLGTFLDQHPSETVVMRLKQECTGELGSCTDVGGQSSFQDIFDSYRDHNAAALKHFWQKSTDRTAWAPTPTLGTIRGKIVLAVMNGPHGSPISNYGLAQFADWHDGTSTYVQDDYTVPNTGAIATKRDQVRRHLDNTNSGDQSKMYVNFGSGSSLFAQPYQVAGGGGGVQGVNPFLLIYLNQGTDTHAEVHRTGMMMLDYPGGGLISKIISFN